MQFDVSHAALQRNQYCLLIAYSSFGTHTGAHMTRVRIILSYFHAVKLQTWGVGHCFAWHVRVNLGFYFNFKIEELVDSGLTSGT